MPGAYLLNQLTDSATLTASSEDTVYPVENLYDELPARVFRSETKTTLSILIDFGEAITCNAIALVNHNLTDEAALTLLEGSASPASIIIANPAWREHDLYGMFPTTTAQYWILQIVDDNPDNIQIGQLLLGTAIALPRARKIGSYSPAKENSNISSETYGGSKYVYPLNKRRKLNPAFMIVGSELDIFEALHDAVEGDAHPFLYIPDTSLAPCYYGRKEAGFDPTEIDLSVNRQIVHDYTMMLTEESRGLEITA
jgi:hypothetical protein